jgi:hypothetical protein
MQMPFGRYQGCGLDEIPEDYLEWLIDDDVIRSARLRQAVLGELDNRRENFRRDYYSAQPPPSSGINVPDAHRPYIDEIVRSGYRTAAMRYHPDQGGSGDQFRALHNAFEWLKERIHR